MDRLLVSLAGTLLLGLAVWLGLAQMPSALLADPLSSRGGTRL